LPQLRHSPAASTPKAHDRSRKQGRNAIGATATTLANGAKNGHTQVDGIAQETLWDDSLTREHAALVRALDHATDDATIGRILSRLEKLDARRGRS